MDTIKFADNSVYDCPFCATTADTAYVALSGVNFATTAAIFANTEKTARMEYGQHALVGFTDLLSVNVQPYGIQAVLRGGTVQEIEQQEQEGD